MVNKFCESVEKHFTFNHILIIIIIILGKNIGKVLSELKEIWIKEDFNIDNNKLLEFVPEIMNEKFSSCRDEKNEIKKLQL